MAAASWATSSATSGSQEDHHDDGREGASRKSACIGRNLEQRISDGNFAVGEGKSSAMHPMHLGPQKEDGQDDSGSLDYADSLLDVPKLLELYHTDPALGQKTLRDDHVAQMHEILGENMSTSIWNAVDVSREDAVKVAFALFSCTNFPKELRSGVLLRLAGQYHGKQVFTGLVTLAKHMLVTNEEIASLFDSTTRVSTWLGSTLEAPNLNTSAALDTIHALLDFFIIGWKRKQLVIGRYRDTLITKVVAAAPKKKDLTEAILEKLVSAAPEFAGRLSILHKLTQREGRRHLEVRLKALHESVCPLLTWRACALYLPNVTAKQLLAHVKQDLLPFFKAKVENEDNWWMYFSDVAKPIMDLVDVNSFVPQMSVMCAQLLFETGDSGYFLERFSTWTHIFAKTHSIWSLRTPKKDTVIERFLKSLQQVRNEQGTEVVIPWLQHWLSHNNRAIPSTIEWQGLNRLIPPDSVPLPESTELLLTCLLHVDLFKLGSRVLLSCLSNLPSNSLCRSLCTMSSDQHIAMFQTLKALLGETVLFNVISQSGGLFAKDLVLISKGSNQSLKELYASHISIVIDILSNNNGTVLADQEREEASFALQELMRLGLDQASSGNKATMTQLESPQLWKLLGQKILGFDTFVSLLRDILPRLQGGTRVGTVLATSLLPRAKEALKSDSWFLEQVADVTAREHTIPELENVVLGLGRQPLDDDVLSKAVHKILSNLTIEPEKESVALFSTNDNRGEIFYTRAVKLIRPVKDVFLPLRRLPAAYSAHEDTWNALAVAHSCVPSEVRKAFQFELFESYWLCGDEPSECGVIDDICKEISPEGLGPVMEGYLDVALSHLSDTCRAKHSILCERALRIFMLLVKDLDNAEKYIRRLPPVTILREIVSNTSLDLFKSAVGASAELALSTANKVASTKQTTTLVRPRAESNEFTVITSTPLKKQRTADLTERQRQTRNKKVITPLGSMPTQAFDLDKSLPDFQLSYSVLQESESDCTQNDKVAGRDLVREDIRRCGKLLKEQQRKDECLKKLIERETELGNSYIVAKDSSSAERVKDELRKVWAKRQAEMEEVLEIGRTISNCLQTIQSWGAELSRP